MKLHLRVGELKLKVTWKRFLRYNVDQYTPCLLYFSIFNSSQGNTVSLFLKSNASKHMFLQVLTALRRSVSREKQNSSGGI